MFLSSNPTLVQAGLGFHDFCVCRILGTACGTKTGAFFTSGLNRVIAALAIPHHLTKGDHTGAGQ